MATANREPSSFRDPSGFVFYRNGEVYRQINQSYRADFEHLTDSGLYDKLVAENLLVPHAVCDEPAVAPESVCAVIHVERVPFISYPYEWCFSQLKDAALLTLKVQRTALEFGMSLKDASAYNVQFVSGAPVFIDTLSFERFSFGRTWPAYQQFCKHFLAPLALMAYRGMELGRMSRLWIDGIPLNVAAPLLPMRTRLKPGLGAHIHLHAGAQSRQADKKVGSSAAGMTKNALLGLLESLESTVSGLDAGLPESTWKEYYGNTNYSESGLEQKARLVDAWLAEVQPRMVQDLGANTGRFSEIAASHGAEVVAMDFDPVVIEAAYRKWRGEGKTTLLPLVMDLTNPSPALGWNNDERSAWCQRGRPDMTFALALVHHLALGNNIPLEKLASFFAPLGRWLVVEFVPIEDSQSQRLIQNREEIFGDYNERNFEAAFGEHYNIEKKERIEESRRTLYLMRSKA